MSKRRSNGEGCIYQRNTKWWIAYRGSDGKRHHESVGPRKEDATTRLLKRTGARENNLPVIPNVERLTGTQALQSVVDDMRTRGRRSIAVVQRRIRQTSVALLRRSAHGRYHGR